MNGPEHYAKAQALLDVATLEDADSNAERYFLRAAQVHATLALTAAVIETAMVNGLEAEPHVDWRKAVAP